MAEYKNFSKELYDQFFDDICKKVGTFVVNKVPRKGKFSGLIAEKCSPLDLFKFAVLRAILKSERYFIANIDAPAGELRSVNNEPPMVDIPHEVTIIEGYSKEGEEFLVLAWDRDALDIGAQIFTDNDSNDDIILTTFHKVMENDKKVWAMSYGTATIKHDPKNATSCIAAFPWFEDEFKTTSEFRDGKTIHQLILKNNEFGFVAIRHLAKILSRDDVVIFEEATPSKITRFFKKQESPHMRGILAPVIQRKQGSAT